MRKTVCVFNFKASVYIPRLALLIILCVHYYFLRRFNVYTHTHTHYSHEFLIMLIIMPDLMILIVFDENLIYRISPCDVTNSRHDLHIKLYTNKHVGITRRLLTMMFSSGALASVSSVQPITWLSMENSDRVVHAYRNHLLVSEHRKCGKHKRPLARSYLSTMSV